MHIPLVPQKANARAGTQGTVTTRRGEGGGIFSCMCNPPINGHFVSTLT